MLVYSHCNFLWPHIIRGVLIQGKEMVEWNGGTITLGMFKSIQTSSKIILFEHTVSWLADTWHS